MGDLSQEDAAKLRNAIKSRRQGSLARSIAGNDQILDEAGAGLSRVLAHMNEPFVVMSAFTGTDKAYNLEMTQKLLRDLKRLRLGAIRFVGHWEGEGGYVSDEISYFVPAGRMRRDPDNFIDLMLALSINYDQEAIVASDGETIYLAYGQDGRMERIGDVATANPEAVAKCWSRVKNKKIKFGDRAEEPSHLDHTKLKATKA